MRGVVDPLFLSTQMEGAAASSSGEKRTLASPAEISPRTENGSTAQGEAEAFPAPPPSSTRELGGRGEGGEAPASFRLGFSEGEPLESAASEEAARLLSALALNFHSLSDLPCRRLRLSRRRPPSTVSALAGSAACHSPAESPFSQVRLQLERAAVLWQTSGECDSPSVLPSLQTLREG